MSTTKAIIWLSFLIIAEFICSFAIHSAIVQVLFEILYRKKFRSDILTLDKVKSYIITPGSLAQFR